MPRNLTPIDETCSIQVTYMTSQVWPTADFQNVAALVTEYAATGSLAGTSFDLESGEYSFGEPQSAHAVCFPAGASEAVSDQHCELYDDVDSLGVLTSSDTTASQADQLLEPFTQIGYGTLWPLGAMPAGVRMPAGSTVWSPDGAEALNIQPDGNTVLYTGGDYPNTPTQVPWWSNTDGEDVAYAEVTEDGVLGLYDADDGPIWLSPAPATAPPGSPYLLVDDGMYTQQASGQAIWSALPSGSAPSGAFDLYPHEDTGVCIAQTPTDLGWSVTDDCGNGNFGYDTEGTTPNTGLLLSSYTDPGSGLNTYCLGLDMFTTEFTSGCPIDDISQWSFPGDMTVRGYWSDAGNCLAIPNQWNYPSESENVLTVQDCGVDSSDPSDTVWTNWQVATVSGQTLPAPGS